MIILMLYTLFTTYYLLVVRSKRSKTNIKLCYLRIRYQIYIIKEEPIIIKYELSRASTW